MKKFMMALVCLMTMVVFSSCSKDNEDDDIKENLLGRWQLKSVGGVKCNTMPLFIFHSNNVLSVGERTYSYNISNGNIKIDGSLSSHLERLYNNEIEYLRINYGNSEDERLLRQQRKEILDNSIPKKDNGTISGNIRVKKEMYIEFICRNNRRASFRFERK